MRTKVVIDPKTGKRENTPEYPMLALREAVANALIHRDYSIQTENAFVQVYMYDDRIVIQNPGGLYGMNKIEKLGTDTVMESRNSTIVRILEEKGAIIENRHSGIPTMRRKMKNMNLPDPEFIEERGSFKVIFRNSTENRGQVGGQVGGQVNIKARASIQEYKIKVKLFCSSPRSAREIREHLGISSRSYVNENIIKPLIDEGVLDYTNKKSVRASNQKYIVR